MTTKSRVREALEQELQRFGLTSTRVRYSGDNGGSNSYILQRWSETWNSYIDVEEDNNLEDKDRVTVVPVTTFSTDSNIPTRYIILLLYTLIMHFAEKEEVKGKYFHYRSSQRRLRV